MLVAGTDRGVLTETLRCEYGLMIDDIEPIPTGFASACYAVIRGGVASHLVKVWPGTNASRGPAARLQRTLPLLRALAARVVGVRVPCPLLARSGELSIAFHQMPLAVFPFLRGTTPPSWPAWPGAIWDELARAMARIHHASGMVGDVLPERDEFGLDLGSQLRDGLARLAALGTDARPGLRRLRDLLQPRTEQLLDELEQLVRVRSQLRTIDVEYVLCHTDLGGDNILVADDGTLSVLDWDEAVMAPAELDIKTALESPDPHRFISVYIEAGGIQPLDRQRLTFFATRRCLEDLTARLTRMLCEATATRDEQDEQDNKLLDGIVRWGLTAQDDVARGIIALAPVL